MYVDYDVFWELLGGERIKGNYYVLLLVIVWKSEVEIVSKKWVEYCCCYVLFDSVVE